MLRQNLNGDFVNTGYDPEPERLAVVKRVVKHLKSIPYSDRRITPSWMSQCEISCGELDFNTAKPTKGEAFLELMPIEKFEEIVGNYAYETDTLSDEPYPPISETIEEAFHMALHIECCLSLVNERGQAFLEDVSWDFWSAGEKHQKLFYHLKKGVVEWQVTDLVRPENHAFPHIGMVLISDATLKEDELLFCEVWMIAVLTTFMLLERSNEVHKIIPITIVSLCSYDARIVQGYIDLDTGKTTINKTPIFRLVENELVREDYMKIITRWLVGTPVGRTTWQEMDCSAGQVS
ncbi:hypothetical protein GGR51DRAFT_202649 [Nemania sp. FL0031]|nr:hypothetical protein GGR51DRAFT_202649 [Nemania sp. FL0031]